MKGKQFDSKAKELFGELLDKHGFSAKESKRSTFCRKVSEDVYHVILPDPSRRTETFDVKVFACSPKIEPLFGKRYPDGLGIPSDSFCYLSGSGIGIDQEHFWCRTGEGMARSFNTKIEPLLVKFAFPYLDGQRSLGEMVAHIRNPLYKALALGTLGDPASKQLLQEQLERLLSFESSDEIVVSHIDRINDLLSRSC